jgi:transposase
MRQWRTAPATPAGPWGMAAARQGAQRGKEPSWTRRRSLPNCNCSAWISSNSAKCLTKSFLVEYLPVYAVIQPFVYDATPNDKVPIVRYVHPLIDTQRDLLDNTMTHDASPRARARAHSLILSAQGMTINAITKISQVDRDTVSTWIRKWEHDGPESLHDKPRSGRPPKLTPAEQQLAIESIKEEPRSLRQVVERFSTKTEKRLSISSLKRLAKRARLRWKRVRKS